MDLIEIIRTNYDKLTHKQKQIADYLMANAENVCYISLKDFSGQTDSSEVTILRTCKALGFRNFIELKQSCRKYTQGLVKNLSKTPYFIANLPSRENGNQKQMLQGIRDSEYDKCVDFFRSVDLDNILEAARWIYKAKNVLIFGQGISEVLTDFFAKRLNLLGINAYAIDPEKMDVAQSRLAKLRQGDVCIAVSFPRYYFPLRNIEQYAAEKKAQIITITDSPSSPIVLKNSLTLFCQTSTAVFFNSLANPLALINLIATGVVLEMGPQYDKLVASTCEMIDFFNSDRGND
jgi:DNA-binding MurR/RpiR family transcriptional regulator